MARYEETGDEDYDVSHMLIIPPRDARVGFRGCPANRHSIESDACTCKLSILALFGLLSGFVGREG